MRKPILVIHAPHVISQKDAEGMCKAMGNEYHAFIVISSEWKFELLSSRRIKPIKLAALEKKVLAQFQTPQPSNP